MHRLLILGPGYCATRFVQRHGAACAQIAATRRGTSPILPGLSVVDWTGENTPAFASAVRTSTALLATAPPGEAGDPFLPAVDAALAERGTMPQQIVYLSTIGVYGDQGGAWVDETAPPQPANPRSRRRLEAEQAWSGLGARRGITVTHLRLPGIYGPGRSVLDDLRAGTARRLVKPDQVFNRVHVDDIAGAIRRVLDQQAGGIFNITDDLPSPPQDVVTFAAELLGMPPPPLVPFDPARLSPMALSFYGENKRASNQKARAVLGWVPAYPDYRDGLRAIVAEVRPPARS